MKGMSKKNPDLRMANIVDLLNRNCDKNDGSNHQRKEKWRNYNMIFFFSSRAENKIWECRCTGQTENMKHSTNQAKIVLISRRMLKKRERSSNALWWEETTGLESRSKNHLQLLNTMSHQIHVLIRMTWV